MRRDNSLLEDIRLACAHIAEFIAGVTREQFLASRLTQSAVEREIITVGEAANRVSDALKAEHPEVPWDRMAQLRNFYTHGYERIKPEVVWGAARRFIPQVSRMVVPLIPKDEESE